MGAIQEKLLFLTGRLAEQRLNNILQTMQPDFAYEVENIGVSVAALMTADMIKRRLSMVDRADRVIVPGLCRGDLVSVSQHFKVPFVHGPDDIKDIPMFFGHDYKPPDLSQHDVMIFAEIVDAPEITVEEIVLRAEQYRRDGADVIDIGCLPDTPFPHLEDSVVALHELGLKVSVDSLEQDYLLRGGRAGADYLLSLNEGNLWIADEVQSIPVLIPEQHGDMDSMYRAIEKIAAQDRPFYADCILDPIHFGFMDSLLRYNELRQQCPDIEIMMGIGNLTELTEADTTGINAVLFGIVSELGINAILTTEVSPHARSAVREADVCRRIMYAARREGSLPKDLCSALLSTHERKPFPYSSTEIRELAAQIRDPSYRIQVSDEGIHAYNRDGIVMADNPFTIFPQLEGIQDDAPHAFYMGVELARAQIAWQLGKRYMQDQELQWGVATEPYIVSDGVVLENGKQSTAYKNPSVTLQASARKRRERRRAQGPSTATDEADLNHD